MQSLFADEDLAGDDVADGDEDLVDEEGLIVDEGRLQTVVADQEARNMSRLLKRFYRTFFIHSSSHDWRFIKAVPGTIETPPRRDLHPFRKEQMPWMLPLWLVPSSLPPRTARAFTDMDGITM
ncbi:hypothetical protein L915_09837 [Phytophthora nicotianae]|uniref:Uncharacterized protein n=1 Tax=Phytophthora nicotianae TaxID=4792 RepID=W2GSI7_PHYNI|nr:hypothetical protein L915_09837 [Phytophthora nicotianae]ETM45157.1 hypothetical protein L914_09712 [Phytophthora nicotianae]